MTLQKKKERKKEKQKQKKKVKKKERNCFTVFWIPRIDGTSLKTSTAGRSITGELASKLLCPTSEFNLPIAQNCPPSKLSCPQKNGHDYYSKKKGDLDLSFCKID